MNTGVTEWTWYLDGNVITSSWLDRPDQGHPQAGGEIFSDIASPSDDQKPHMLAQGRNYGTSGDGDYFCFKNNQAIWYRWNPSYAANTKFPPESSGITFSPGSPQYSYFDATGE